MSFYVGEPIGTYINGETTMMTGTYLRTDGQMTWGYWGENYHHERFTVEPVFSRDYDLKELD